MGMKKKRGVLIGMGVILIAMIVFVVAVCFRQPTAKEEEGTKRQETELPDEEETEEPDGKNGETDVPPDGISFENFSVLESKLTPEQIETVKGQLAKFLQEEGAAYPEVVCQEIILETERGLEFYCEIPSVPGTVLHCVFDGEIGELKVVEEKIDTDVLNRTAEPEENVGTPEEETGDGVLPSAWDYVEEDDTTVQMEGKELLEEKFPSGKLPAEQLENLETELLAFLKENQEYRRKFSVVSDGMAETESGVEFWLSFTTERLDKKEVRCVLDASVGWKFFLEERNGAGDF